MQKVQIYMQNEAAHETIDRLGDKGMVMFNDLNSEKTAFQRTFASYVKRCDEMERVLRFLGECIDDARIEPRSREVDRRDEPNFTDLQMRLEELEKEVRKITTNKNELSRTHDEVMELKCVLETASTFFGSTPTDIGTGEEDYGNTPPGQTPLLDVRADNRFTNRLGCVTGVIASSEIPRFERLLWRATRGNVYVKSAPIKETLKDPKSGLEVDKSVIAIFYSGERSLAKIGKLCDTNGVNKYQCPEDSSERGRLMQSTKERENDLKTVIDRTLTTQNAVLGKIAESLLAWQTQVKREKAIYHTLNLTNFDRKRQCLIAEGWVPVIHLDHVNRILHDASVEAGASVPSVCDKIATKETPPTHFEVNKFTTVFQSIVDSYGIARYQEYNPAVFTTITFPFLFAVMFGDAGHGVIMTCVALIMLWYEKKLLANYDSMSEMLQYPFNGRYIILLMGMFSIYTGCIYNDAFSQPYNFFESQWEDYHNNTAEYRNEYTRVGQFSKDLNLHENDGEYTHEPYPFGIDPEWSHCSNKLPMMNSFKMKISIVFGVSQMLAGNLCKLTNALHFKQQRDLWFEFLPEITFMFCLFGYLVILIFVKWGTDYPTRCVFIPPGGSTDDAEIVTCCARSLTNRCDGMMTNGLKMAGEVLSEATGDLSRSEEGYKLGLGAYKDVWAALSPLQQAAIGFVPVGSHALMSAFPGMADGTIGKDSVAVTPQLYSAGVCDVNGKKYPEQYKVTVMDSSTSEPKFKEFGACYKQGPPSLLSTLINFFMAIGTVKIDDELFAGQGATQMILVLIAVISVPILLFPKPCLERLDHKNKLASRHHSEEGEDEEEFDFSEHMVHQTIHTIEYVLGAVSNTASYLRLWALSLAHAELSEVFWDKVLAEQAFAVPKEGEKADGVVMYAVKAFCCFAIWTVLTFGVLMVMESLSAFLHALRLHWVEFQNKFYKGDGYKFIPFSYQLLFAKGEE